MPRLPPQPAGGAARLEDGMDPTKDQARRLIDPPREDLLYERAFSRMLAKRPRSKAQRRELLARQTPDGYPVPLRWDPTLVRATATEIALNPFRHREA